MSNFVQYSGAIPPQLGDFILESAVDNITATAGGNYGNALQINSQTARVTTVASSGDAIKLPAAIAGLELLIINHGNNPMTVYGATSPITGAADNIDDVAGKTGVTQLQNSFVLYSCASAGNWYTEGLASGFVRGQSMQTFSSQTIAGNTTVTQAAGTPVTAMLANITGGAATAATLPVSAPGMEITVHNLSAFTVSVFPNAAGTGTETINALGANAAISLPTNTSTVFTSAAAGQWYTVPRVPS